MRGPWNKVDNVQWTESDVTSLTGSKDTIKKNILSPMRDHSNPGKGVAECRNRGGRLGCSTITAAGRCKGFRG